MPRSREPSSRWTHEHMRQDSPKDSIKDSIPDSPDSAGSPLSSIASDDFPEDMKLDDMDMTFDSMQADDAADERPSKRRRTDIAWDNRTSISHQSFEGLSEISSDTSGDVPSAAWDSGILGIGMGDEDPMGQEQVTVCRWDGCEAGDLGDMDALVKHIHKAHIGIRQKKYSCEWGDCPRKGAAHASGYALRAHMRSHTREKPFYCALPECDRSFTRSDALAKHMRTVHETEALRPSDPIPKHHYVASNSSKPQRLKLVFSSSRESDREVPNGHHESAADDSYIENSAPSDDDLTIADDVSVDANGATLPAWQWPNDIGFEPSELALKPDQLYRLLRQKVRWAETESNNLKLVKEKLLREHRRAWQEKELALANLMEAKLAEAVVRNPRLFENMFTADLPEVMLPLSGETPWYRKREEIEKLEKMRTALHDQTQCENQRQTSTAPSEKDKSMVDEATEM